jgi:5-methylcytosine-specific restriction endonuclease McrA
MKTLLLNADYTPIDVINWKKAIVMALGYDAKPAHVLEYYPKVIRDSMGRVYPIPAVIVLRTYINMNNNKATYNKANIFYRDKFICQYCGKQYSRSNLTVDHVIPKSKWKQLGHKGTSSCFENIVTACFQCNSKKADRTPQEAKMSLINGSPRKVDRRQAVINKIINTEVPEKWKPYLESIMNV